MYKIQGFSGVDDLEGGVCGLRAFGKARQYELEFMRVTNDISNSKDARPVGRAGGGLDPDQTVMDIQSPFIDRPQFTGQTEEG